MPRIISFPSACTIALALAGGPLLCRLSGIFSGRLYVGAGVIRKWIGAVAVATMGYSGVASAATIADLAADYQAYSFGQFRYLWNAPVGWETGTFDGSTGAIGDSSSYLELMPTANGRWTPDGDTNFTNSVPDFFMQIGPGSTSDTLFGHPGNGALQNGGVGNTLDRYLITEYNVQVPGSYALKDGFVEDVNANGLTTREVQIYVNDSLVQSFTQQDPADLNFEVNLGHLNAGDKIRVAYGPDGNDGFDGFQTNFNLDNSDYSNIVVEASLADDFQSATFPDGWRYAWNAPDGWGTVSVDGSTGAISDPSSYLDLMPTGDGRWTPDGDTNFTNSTPDFFMQIGPGSTSDTLFGHPGNGELQSGGVGNTLDRYLITEYTIQTDGEYWLLNGFVDDANANGLTTREVLIFKNHSLIQTLLQSDPLELYFYLSLGNLVAGDIISVAFGPDGSDGFDGFRANFDIVRFERNVNAVPLPAALPLFAGGLGGLGVMGWWRRRSAATC